MLYRKMRIHVQVAIRASNQDYCYRLRTSFGHEGRTRQVRL